MIPDNMYPICLPVTSDMLIKDNSHYVKATAAGWGFLKTGMFTCSHG